MSKQKTMAEILGDIRNSSDKEKTIREFLEIEEIDLVKADPMQEKAQAIGEFANSLGVNILMAIMDPKTKQSSTAGAVPFEVEGTDTRTVVTRLLCGNVDSLIRQDPLIGLCVIRTLNEIPHLRKPENNGD